MRRLLKDIIVDRVRATFNDRARGEQPVQPSADALFPPGSVVRRVHADVTSMMIGGVSALLLQMLHPAVLAGVWDHSAFRRDMHGRLRRTARFIAVTTYGARGDAEQAIAQVRRVHGHVRGTLEDGTAYSANDPALLAWVHATETICFLDAYLRFTGHELSSEEQDRYFAETASIGIALGAGDVPVSRAGTLALIERMRPQLRVDARTREVARLLMTQPPANPAILPVQRLTFQAGIDLLPGWARQMHGLRSSALSRPLVHAAARGLADTIGWAFRP